MHWQLTRVVASAIALAGCGRLGFDEGLAQPAIDSAVGDGVDVDAPLGADAPPAAATVNFISTTSSTNNQATYTFTNVSIGTAAADRIVVVCAFLGGGAITPITAITVGGMSLTLTAGVTDGVSGAWAIGYATLSTGTTAQIDVTSVTAGRAAIAVYNVTASSSTPLDADAVVDPLNNAGAITSTIDTMAGGVIIANAGYGSNTPTWGWSGSWTGYSVNLNTSWAGEQGTYTSAASGAVTVGGLQTVTATPSGATPKLLSVVSWR